jgi:c-di-GMP-binding flagellar brake protein YcgR
VLPTEQTEALAHHPTVPFAVNEENCMERRNHARIAREFLKHISVTFSGKANGTGTLYDLSTGGCKIEASSTPPLGASLTLRLALPYHTYHVMIDAAVVGWTIKNQYFGVKFLDIHPQERLALEQFMAALAIGVPAARF